MPVFGELWYWWRFGSRGSNHGFLGFLGPLRGGNGDWGAFVAIF